MVVKKDEIPEKALAEEYIDACFKNDPRSRKPGLSTKKRNSEVEESIDQAREAEVVKRLKSGEKSVNKQKQAVSASSPNSLFDDPPTQGREDKEQGALTDIEIERFFISLRKKLLDLTTRSRLLNYRHPPARSLRVVDELPNQIVKKLLEGSEVQIFACSLSKRKRVN